MHICYSALLKCAPTIPLQGVTQNVICLTYFQLRAPYCVIDSVLGVHINRKRQQVYPTTLSPCLICCLGL